MGNAECYGPRDKSANADGNGQSSKYRVPTGSQAEIDAAQAKQVESEASRNKAGLDAGQDKPKEALDAGADRSKSQGVDSEAGRAKSQGVDSEAGRSKNQAPGTEEGKSQEPVVISKEDINANMVAVAVTRLELFVVFRTKSLGRLSLNKDTVLSKSDFSNLLAQPPASIPVAHHEEMIKLAESRINAGLPEDQHKKVLADGNVNYQLFLQAFEPDDEWAPESAAEQSAEDSKKQLVEFVKKDKLNRGRVKAVFFFWDENNNGNLGQEEFVHALGELNRRFERKFSNKEAVALTGLLFGEKKEMNYKEFRSLVEGLEKVKAK